VEFRAKPQLQIVDHSYCYSIYYADGAKSLMAMGWAEDPALAMGLVLVNAQMAS